MEPKDSQQEIFNGTELVNPIALFDIQMVITRLLGNACAYVPHMTSEISEAASKRISARLVSTFQPGITRNEVHEGILEVLKFGYEQLGITLEFSDGPSIQ